MAFGYAAPAQANCVAGQAFTSLDFVSGDFTYIQTPGRIASPTASTVSSGIAGSFWALGEGDPALGSGIDNGSYGVGTGTDGWIIQVFNQSAFLSGNWSDADVDGCIDDASAPRCMAIALSDLDGTNGFGAFALVSALPDAAGGPYLFAQDNGANLNLSVLPLPAAATADTTGGLTVTLSPVTAASIAPGLYEDPSCPSALAGFQTLYRAEPKGGPAPTDFARNSWTPATGNTIALDNGEMFDVACNGDLYLATGLVFDSGFEPAFVSPVLGPFACPCGNGTIEAGEDCDDSGESATCNVDCSTSVCGDGIVNAAASEQCDDGGTVSGDGCSSTCVLELICGNGIIDPGEDCDDGAESATCNADCTAHVCGDGVLNATAGETCDDGNTDPGDGCRSNCTPEICGDGIVDPTEDCDDTGESATCNVDCTTSICGDEKRNETAGEDCDDGNAIEGDGCSSICTCTYSLSASEVSASEAGGSAGVIMFTASTCEWVPTSEVGWIAFSGSLTGEGPINMTVDANRDGKQRSATVTVATESFTVTQRRLAAAALTGFALVDNGDQDGFADTGETVNMYLKLENRSGVTVGGVAATLTSSSPHIECILQPTINVGSLAPGEELVTSTAFQFKIGNVNRSTVEEVLTAQVTVELVDNNTLAVVQTPIALHLDLDPSGGTSPTSFFEGFEAGSIGSLGSQFVEQSLDTGFTTAEEADGYRCQYSDPDWSGASSFNSSQGAACFPGTGADIFHFGTTDDRAFGGTRSLYYGVDIGALGFSTPPGQLEAARTTDPINLDWGSVCETTRSTRCLTSADCPGVESCVAVMPELSFKHQISLVDSRTLNTPTFQSVGRAIVQAQLADDLGNPVGDWIKLQPYINKYETEAQSQFFNCSFDPPDDGNNEEDFFDPGDPLREFGPSSTCRPELNFVHQGSTDGAFSAAAVGRASGDPGLAGTGVGTWVEPRFSLAEYRGRRLRLRFLVTDLKVGGFTSWESIFTFNPDPADDGWFIDDVLVTDTLVNEANLAVDTKDNSALPTCNPCGNGVVEGEEDCDDAGGNSDVDPDACRTDCTLPRCGDQVVDSGETCDGPGLPTATCDSDCTVATCGDGTLNPSAGEECDDGGQVSGDGCRADCTIEFCGDGIQDALEQCDESGETKSCDVDCTLATCGDNTLNATRGEECDDGNTVDGDGCEANCTTADAADRTRFAAKERVLPGSDELGAPESAFVADVDGDGDLDVLTASSSDNLIGWFENINGEATFNTLKVISTSVLSAKDVTAADIDGDGDLDALSAASGDGTIAWYANQDGAGSFGPSIAISSAVTSASAVLVADIDGDGDADVIAGGAADGPNALVWFENTDGAGSFGAPNPISGAGTTSVVLADINRDGAQDLLAYAESSGEFSWYENDGAAPPTFTQRVVDNTVPGANWVAVGDLNRDGRLDLILADDDALFWYENDGAAPPNWTRRTVSGAAAGDLQGTVAVDLDEDGDVDVLSANAANDEIAWYENSGTSPPGWTKRIVDPGADPFVRKVLAADLDRDGDEDVLQVNPGAGARLGWFANRTIHHSAAYPEPLEIANTLQYSAVAAIDVDGDGAPDVAAGSGATGRIDWYRNTSPNGFTFVATASTTASDLAALLPADLDRDGDPDLVRAGQTLAWIRTTGGALADELAIGANCQRYTAAATADVDRDGDTDVVSGCVPNVGAGNFAVGLWENDGTPGDGGWGFQGIAELAALASPTVGGIALGDLDRDGDHDVLVAATAGDGTGSAQLAWYENIAPGFGPAQIIYAATANPLLATALADVDRDGDLDVITAAQDVVFWNENEDGAGAFGDRIAISKSLPVIDSLSIADVDDDGDPDILAASSTLDSVTILENRNGFGGFWVAKDVATASTPVDGPRSMAIADLDLDARPDLVLGSFDDSTLSWYPNQGGEYLLDATDAGNGLAFDSELTPLIGVNVTFHGRSGDPLAIVDSFTISFNDGASRLSVPQLDALVSELRIYRDEGSGVFEPNADVQLATTVSTGPDLLRTLSVPAADPNVRVAAPVTFFIVAQMRSDASSQTPRTFTVTHFESASRIVDADTGVPLAREVAPPDLSTSIATTAVGRIAVNTIGDDPDLVPGNGLCETAFGTCSLRAAIQEANAQPGNNRIVLDSVTYFLATGGVDEDQALTGDLDVTDTAGTLTVVGAGAEGTVIDAGGLDRVFELHTGASLILLDVSLTGGALPGATGRGGGIRNNGGTLSIIRTDIRGNGAGSGAGVDNTSGDTLIEDSLIRDNVGVQAAAVSNFAGTTTIRNTTVSANAATNGAVGLIGGSLTIESSTVAVNSAIGLLNVANAPFTVSNTIVANNAFDAQGPFSSGGQNLIGDVGTATGFMDGVNGDQVGGNGSPPVLAALVPLGDYGGPTLTHSLGFGSPAIDAGSCSSLKTDQRGSPRRVDLEDAANVDDACDIGAVELALAPTLSRLVVPVRWCGVRGAPSIEDPTVVGETSVNDVLRARHENVTNQIFGPQANIELRSAANAKIEEYPILDDPDCVEDPPGTFTCEIGQHGDVFVNPDTGNFDEFQNLIADCRAAWQAQDPTIVGVTAVQINRFVDADGNPRGLLGIGGRAQVNNAAEQTVASRVMVVDRFYRIDVPGNPDPPNPLDRSDQLLGHEFGHAASLSHGDGIDNNGDGDLDNDDESAIGDPQLDGSNLMQYRNGLLLTDAQVERARAHLQATIPDLLVQPLVNTVANAEPIDPATEAILQFGYSGVADLQGASVLEFQGASVLEFEDELIQELQGASVLEFQDEGVPEFQGASVLEFGMNILGTTGADETVLHSSIGSLLWPAVIRPTTRYFFFLDLDRSDATGAFPLDRVNPTDAPNNFPGRANFTGGGEVAEESGVDLIAQVVLKQSCPGQVCSSTSELTVFDYNDVTDEYEVVYTQETTPIRAVGVGLVQEVDGDEETIPVGITLQPEIPNQILFDAGWGFQPDGAPNPVRMETLATVECSGNVVNDDPTSEPVDCQCTSCAECPNYPGCTVPATTTGGTAAKSPVLTPLTLSGTQILTYCNTDELAFEPPVLPECTISPQLAEEGQLVTVNVTNLPTDAVGLVEATFEGDVVGTVSTAAIDPTGTVHVPVLLPMGALGVVRLSSGINDTGIRAECALTVTPAAECPDNDFDEICDADDPDDDNDGVLDVDDASPFNPTACADDDGDLCDDCAQGSVDPSNDGPDFDMDGECDFGDLDDDNDGVNDTVDPEPQNALVCGDSDSDECDDCSSGTNDPSNDGPDSDNDGQCDACGNGVIQVDAGEECDDAGLNSNLAPNACRENCRAASCGDGVVDAGEACDDGNAQTGDGCRPDCSEELCGDGMLDPGEECDDGGIGSGDGCDGSCLLENCADGDGDGYGLPGASVCPNGAAPDCNDSNATVFPGAPELCDGIDNDCDSQIPADEIDDDGDTIAECAGDCNDEDSSIFPGAFEILCDDIDQNCSLPFDDDNENVDGDPVSFCDGDCDDNDPARYPGNVEICDGIDNDCDSQVPANEIDGDGDTFSECAGDCNDGDVTIFPGAPETLCDNIDQNCSLPLDDDSENIDGDPVSSCDGDCDDNDAARYPGNAEICDGKDNDCDWQVPANEIDGDGDGLAECEGDCDDGNSGIFSGAPEIPCDGIDQNCSLPGVDDDCVIPICGDGFLHPAEACDDGNLIGGDGCSPTCELITNGDFSASRAPWVFYTNGIGTYTTPNDVARVRIAIQGTNVQLFQANIAVKGNTQYRLRFTGRNTAGNNVAVQLLKHTSPFTNYGLSQAIPLNTTDKNFDIMFTTTPGDKTDGRLRMLMSPYDTNGSTYFFDNFVLEEMSQCGDGVVDAGEACDDGNTVAEDGCSATCQQESCGDGVVQAGLGETCDDGNTTAADGCDETCQLECGNGTLEGAEQCDDNNTTSGDGCSATCTIEAVCGNGTIEDGETCDDGNTASGDGCSASCQIEVVCGDGVLAGAEQCDDNNLIDGDGCDSNCTPTGCGNGISTVGEACDDGNAVEGDGCDSNCTVSACGNAVQDPTEGCDDGNLLDGDGCDSDCSVTACGNGIPTTGEACDDGNSIEGDGCDSNCTVSACGNGIQDPSEACDDGNVAAGDGCSATCTLECGDGALQGAEECDDGNTLDGDGCSSTCELEPPPSANIIVNGDFSGGKAPWVFFTNGAGIFLTNTGEARLRITTAGGNVQLFQPGLALEGNTTYELTFRARHTAGRDLRARLIKHTAPYSFYGLDQFFNLTTGWQTFTVTFTTTPGDKTDGRLMFWLAPYDLAGHDYFIDDVVLKKL